MKKCLCILCMLVCISVSAKREYTSPYKLKYNTVTTYQDRVFETTSYFNVNAPISIAQQVMEKFIYDLNNDPYSLFDNILKGMGDVDDNKEENSSSSKFSIEITSCVYDTAHNYYIGKLNFIIGRTSIDDITLYGRITKTNKKDCSTYIFELLNNPVAKTAKGVITLKKTSETATRVDLVADFQFSWFLNLFFTQKNYKNVAEWRLDRFMQNLNEEIIKENAK